MLKYQNNYGLFNGENVLPVLKLKFKKMKNSVPQSP